MGTPTLHFLHTRPALPLPLPQSASVGSSRTSRDPATPSSPVKRATSQSVAKMPDTWYLAAPPMTGILAPMSTPALM
uniref:Uncharacterized protein n=1 Tax=Arundo donax TaxID=35708 RepID=A0A0A8ZJK4_ARUDO